MASATPPKPPVKDDNAPTLMGVQPRPGGHKPNPKPMIFTDFASI